MPGLQLEEREVGVIVVDDAFRDDLGRFDFRKGEIGPCCFPLFISAASGDLGAAVMSSKPLSVRICGFFPEFVLLASITAVRDVRSSPMEV